MLIRAKLYRLFAYVFAVAGLGLFAFVYHSQKSASLVETFENPVILMFMVVPFLPAFVLILKARKYEKDLLKIINTFGE